MAQTFPLMRRLWMLFTLVACGDDAATIPDGPGQTPDTSQMCLPQSAVGSFYRRGGNPKMIAGTHTFGDAKLDTAIADPDLRWDGSTWHLYYQSPHGTSFTAAGPQVIRHATSADLTSWTFTDAPSLTVANTGWDSTHTETPSVAYNPDAPADRRYLMMYSGSSAVFPNYTFQDYAIGAAFSADGITFTRVSAADSPKGQAGLVLTGSDAYPGSADGIVADPEVVFVGGMYHLWFSSFACSGTNCGTVDAYGIGHATSTDGIHWTVEAAPVKSLLRASADNKTGGGQPSVVYDSIHCRWEMWMTNDLMGDNASQPVRFNNMQGVYNATSTNGMTWSVNYQFIRDLVWEPTASGEHLGLLTGADVAGRDNGRYMAYVGFDDQNVPAGSVLPTATGTVPGVFTLNLATRDAPP